jgi:hypothetical protein
MFKDLMRVDHDNVSIHRTNARVRAFLSHIEALDALLQPACTKPLFLAKYNFPLLLRVLQHLKHFGNIRDLYEGGVEGEGMVKLLRVLVPNGLKDLFATHLLHKAFRDYILDRFLPNRNHRVDNVTSANLADNLADGAPNSDHETEAEALQREALDEEPDPFLHMRHVLAEPEDTGDGELERGYTMNEQLKLLFCRYSSRAIVEHYFALGVPISVVITNQAGKQ